MDSTPPWWNSFTGLPDVDNVGGLYYIDSLQQDGTLPFLLHNCFPTQLFPVTGLRGVFVALDDPDDPDDHPARTEHQVIEIPMLALVTIDTSILFEGKGRLVRLPDNTRTTPPGIPALVGVEYVPDPHNASAEGWWHVCEYWSHLCGLLIPGEQLADFLAHHTCTWQP